MKLKELFPKIYHLRFKTKKELASTFMRFQEYYESPKFKGKIFSRKEFIKWYSGEFGKVDSWTGKKCFTYFSDWGGFNIPSKVLKPFYRGDFDPLTRQEKRFLSLFENIKDKFYIIGTYSVGKKLENDLPITIESLKKIVDKTHLFHEIAHALWYLNKNYRSEIRKVIANLIKKINKNSNSKICRRGYHPSVFEDELHAYLLTDIEKAHIFINNGNLEKYSERVKDIYFDTLAKMVVKNKKKED